MREGAVPWLTVLLGAAPMAVAQQAAPPEDTLAVHGFVDVVYAHDFNRPADRATFFPGVGTAAKRHGEFSLNQAQIELGAPPSPVGFRLALGFGTALEVVHSGEPDGAFANAGVFRNVLYASAQYKAPVGSGLLLEAGIFPCHVGFEGFNTKDNWNYTRSWLAEFSPYYSAGVRASYSWNERWSSQLHVLNGWQIVSENNSAKSIGAQIAYTRGSASLFLNVIGGPERPDNEKDWRVLADLVANVKVSSALFVGTSFDIATESRPGKNASWNGIAAYARLSPPTSKTALALRVERFADRDGAISSTRQRLAEATLTLEHRPAPGLIVKLEGRYDRSTAALFAATAHDGSPVLRRHQLLVLAGVVAAF
jgi:hypothetical protein